MYLQELELIPEKVKEALETNDRAKEIATVKDAPNCLYLGRGYNFPLHLKEL
jgi:glucosamine--fructose-6-phosphate aminotransferase (isomerizing)